MVPGVLAGLVSICPERVDGYPLLKDMPRVVVRGDRTYSPRALVFLAGLEGRPGVRTGGGRTSADGFVQGALLSANGRKYWNINEE